MTRLRSALALLSGVCALAVSEPAFAWGGYGHAIVADIAETRLTPTAMAGVRHLLALDGEHSMDQVASWPDEIGHVPADKGGLPQTLPWHYVDIDVSNPAYDAARDCPTGECVAAKLPELIDTLRNPAVPVAKRLIALKWVVHLVGDLHQPLHTSERNDDKGGNAVKLTYYGSDHHGHMNLHSLWDEGVLDHEANLHVGPHYSIDFARARAEAQVLNAHISPEDAADWGRGVGPGNDQAAIIGWINESHVLASKVAYGALPKGNNPDIGDDYSKIAWPVIERRLEQAGVRLAAILNANLTQPIGMTLR